MNSKVLMVMPCYNAEEFILESIISATKQTYKNYVLVCCDDKSTDNTYQILKDNQHKYKYLLFNNEKNLGTGSTVNKMIKMMCENQHFDFITWISADNILFSNFIEEHVKKLNEGFAITYSGWMSFGEMMNIPEQYPCDNLLELKNSYKLGPSFMFRKKLWDIAGPFNNLPGEDYYFAVKCALNDAKFGFIKNILVKYRLHNNSVSSKLLNIIEDNTTICSFDAIKYAQNINNENGKNNFI